MIEYNENFSAAERLLVLALKEQRSNENRLEIINLYGQLGDKAVHQTAVLNKVVPMAAHGLTDSIPLAELPEHWRQAHSDTENKVSAFFKELDRLAKTCNSSSIRIVAIENGGIARGVQRCRGCFASSDIEILVNPDQLEVFEQILVKEGYERRSRERCASESSNQWNRDIRGWDNYCKKLPGGYDFWLNVQWRAVLRRWVPMERGLESSDLINRSVPIGDPSSCVRILSPEDNLLVCALHVASHSYVRGIGLRLQLDVDRLVHNVKLDWDAFLMLVNRHDAAELVFPSLAIPASIFGTPIPENVFDALVPSARKRTKILELISSAGIMNRGSHKFSPLQFVKLEMALAHGGMIDGLLRVFLPPSEWLQEGYRHRGNPSVLYCYFDRLADLAKRRQA